MTDDEVLDRMAAVGPWVHPIEFRGRVYRDPGAGPDRLFSGLVRETRAARFYDAFPDARRVLELGTLEAADTVRLASRPGVSVVSIEGRPENLRRAQFVLDLHGLNNVELVSAELESFDLATLGRFAAVLCSGILYHLVEPWKLVARLAGVTDRVYLWTHYWDGPHALTPEAGFLVKTVQEQFPEPRLRGLSSYARWFDRASLFRVLRENGFSAAVLDERGHGSVREVTLACSRHGGAV